MLSQEKNKKSASIVESRPEPWLERIFFGALLYLPLIAIGLVSLIEEVNNNHIMLLPVAVAAANTLFNALGVPGQIKVDQG